jgi:hypothetical protein
MPVDCIYEIDATQLKGGDEAYTPERFKALARRDAHESVLSGIKAGILREV